VCVCACSSLWIIKLFLIFIYFQAVFYFVFFSEQEKMALKKLENVRSDHTKRLEDLDREQTTDMQKAQLIEINLSLVM